MEPDHSLMSDSQISVDALLDRSLKPFGGESPSGNHVVNRSLTSLFHAKRHQARLGFAKPRAILILPGSYARGRFSARTREQPQTGMQILLAVLAATDGVFLPDRDLLRRKQQVTAEGRVAGQGLS